MSSTEPSRLDERIPERGLKSADDAMSAFLGWVSDSGLTLYPHQEEAILEIFAGNHVVLDAPTGSGKSLVALALHFKTFAELGRTWYTAPIKALVSEKFFALCKVFGPEHVGMMTGDGAINRDAPIVCCTAEILANLALREGDEARADTVVMDEFHYYADRDRGISWQIPLLTLSKTTFLLMSATLGDTAFIREDLERRTGRTVSEVRGAHRPVPLHFKYSKEPIQEALQRLVREGKAPVYVVHFTQSAAAEAAQALMSVDWCTREEKKTLQAAVSGFRFHSPFGPTLRRYVLHGVGLHHAGLLPRYRLLVERLAQQGLLKIICGTDTLGVGVNVPIRTVLFTQLCKFDGQSTNLLKVREFKQIAGRAGRAGFDTAGYVVVQAPAHVIENTRIDETVTDPKKRRKIVRAQPPARGYKHWDEEIFQQLVDRPPEALESRFTVDHGRLLMMMQHGEETTGDAARGYEALLDLIATSHATANERISLAESADALLESLKNAGVVYTDGYRLKLDPNLQREFSLHHPLSLFLLAALETLDPASPSFAHDLLSWVESILEDPRAVMLRQQDRARSIRLMELKAAGVPYEERIEALEEVTWPKPNEELAYGLFEVYLEKHPWVEKAGIHPKSIAREMAEQYISFGDYVKDLGLQRIEGVLLRYLSEVYKALVQNVPDVRWTEELRDIIAWLRALLAVVDSSLLMEWEQLIAGRDVVAAPPKIDISQDRRSFHARIRAELASFVRALSRENWEEAAIAIRRGDADPFGPEALAATLAPFVMEHRGVRFDHYARLTEHTTITPDGPHRWTVRHLIHPLPPPAVEDYGQEPDEDDAGIDERAWVLEAVVDLREDTNPDGPLIRVERIGV